MSGGGEYEDRAGGRAECSPDGARWRDVAAGGEKRECAEREVKMRRRVYPNWIAAGRMTQEAADKQIAMMDEIAADYRGKSELPL